MTGDDRWIRAAYTDDAVVAELLLRLKQSSWDFSPQSPLPEYGSVLPVPVGWGHRQPRSKPASTTTTTTAAAVTPSCSKKVRESPTTRCSPTTPLSWSSASTSDESCRPSDLSSGGRSKSVFPAESATTSKKSRKGKSFAELKEVEGFLLEERTHLKKELASMQVTFKQHIDTSANLKRLKHGLHFQSGNNVEKRLSTIDYPFNQTEASSSFNHSHSTMHDYRLSKLENDVETQERGFIVPDLNAIPDLNMSPTEEETGAGNLHAMS